MRAFFILVVFSIALVLTSCAIGEPYPYKSIKRAHVKQNCKTFRNWGLPDDEFVKYVHWLVDGTGYIRMRQCEGMTLDGKTVIKMIVVYYNERED